MRLYHLTSDVQDRGRGCGWQPPKVFLSFLLEDKTSAPDFNFNGCDARYTTSHALLCRSIV